MNNDEKLNKINEAIHYLTQKGEKPQIKKIVAYLGMTTQNFYFSYKDYVDYVNNCIDTINFSNVYDEVKKIDSNFTLIELHKTTKKVKNLLLQCSNPNHEPFLSSKYRIRCPKCHQEQLEKAGLAKAHAIAKSHGGQCLSNAYTNQLSKLTFKCSNPNHAPWTTTFLNVLYGKSWCRACTIDNNKKSRG